MEDAWNMAEKQQEEKMKVMEEDYKHAEEKQMK